MKYTTEEWRDICYLEMNSGANDGWTTKYYREEYEKACKKLEKKNRKKKRQMKVYTKSIIYQ